MVGQPSRWRSQPDSPPYCPANTANQKSIFSNTQHINYNKPVSIPCNLTVSYLFDDGDSYVQSWMETMTNSMNRRHLDPPTVKPGLARGV